MKPVTILAALLIFSTIALALSTNALARTTWYVDDSNPTWPGSGTPGDPFVSIQVAINHAVDGDMVLVMPGTYNSINFQGKAITVISSEGPVNTIIDGQQSGSGVRFITAETKDAVLEGFTVTNGTGTLEGTFVCGGGIYCRTKASPTITGNIITGNSVYAADYGAMGLGGGICCYDPETTPHGNARIMNNIIHGNGADAYLIPFGQGGGVCIHGSNAVVSGNEIYDNWAIQGGGAALLGWGTESTVYQNNIIHDNESFEGGGAMLITWADGVVTNNTIFRNTSPGGGGIFIIDTIAAVTNNTLYDNTATSGPYGGGMGYLIQDPAKIGRIHNNIIWNNPGGSFFKHSLSLYDPVVTYCDVEGGWPGKGNIDADPLFVDPANDDLHIRYDSPCRNRGDDAAPGLPGTDFESDPRIAHGKVDMGADEFYPHLYIAGHLTPGGAVEIKFVGLPGTTQVAAIVGVNIHEPPLPCDYGLWYMDDPFLIYSGFGAIPSTGVLILPGTIPLTPPAPYAIYVQGCIDYLLTNLYPMDIE